MIKKLYTLFSVLLLLASCATEEIEQIEIQPTDGSMVSLSFSVDAPNALEITKATGDVEKGVESLYLYTFKENGEFISPVVKAEVSGNGYTATISKETRTIHFVANDGTLTPSQESGMASLATDKQIFWGKRTFSEIPAKNISNNLEDAGNNNVELLRNWAKITLNLSSEAAVKLKNVSYLIYNESQLASIGYKDAGKLNIPNQDFYAPQNEPDASRYAKSGESVYTFEHYNQDKKATFVIIKAQFAGNDTYTYYKIDLAVKDENDKVTRVYDVVRNYAFNITVKSVSRKGATWAEVIDENVIADNNITASAIMEKYPNITYDGEALNVTKTTFVFTGSSNTLSMTATYAGAGQLSVVPDEGMSDVVDGNLSYPSWIPSGNQTITITANIKPAPGTGEKIAYFYVVGGNLQRKIKLVLRPPYNFINPRFENVKVGTGTNEISAGQQEDVYLKFSIPEDVDESLFPIEYKIYTKKLYAVESGVRLETTGKGDWYYVYTDQVFNTDEKIIRFKTNTSNEAESDVILKSELFNPVTDLTYTRISPRSITGTIKFGTTSNNWNIRKGESVSYTAGSKVGTFIVGDNGAYSLEIPRNYSGNIAFSYTVNGMIFEGSGSVDQQSSGLDIILSANGMSLITGKMYYEGSYGNGTIEIPESGEISVSNNNVRVMITGKGGYVLFYNNTFNSNTNFNLTYDPGSGWSERKKTMNINTLKTNTKIILER